MPTFSCLKDPVTSWTQSVGSTVAWHRKLELSFWVSEATG
jgi:hypothetical protein